MFGQILAKLRKQRKMSQYELAEKMGFSRGQIANYEQGTRQPDFDTLERFADYFEVSTDYLLGRSSHPELSAQRDKEVNEEVEELIKLLETMPDEKRKEMEARILAYAQGLADANNE